MSDELIREVDEDVRRDQWLALWKAYGKYIVGGIAAIVLVIGGRSGWNAYREYTFEKDSVRYEAAVSEAGKARTADAVKILDRAIKDVSSLSAYGSLLELKKAEAAAHAGDVKAARAAYEAVAAHAGDARLKSYGALMAAMYAAEAGDGKGAAAALTPLAAEGEPFAFSAKELLGHLALKRGDEKAAIDYFQRLSGRDDTPPAIRVRAEQMLASLGHPVKEKVLERDIAAASAAGDGK